MCLQRTPRVHRATTISCRCRPKAGSYNFFQGFLGQLLIGYAASPILRHKPGRVHYPKAGGVLRFTFPEWFLYYTLTLRAQFDAYMGLSYSLNLSPAVSTHHLIFDWISNGDIDKLKDIFGSQQLSPEARAYTGGGFLQVINSRCFKAGSVLISQHSKL